MGRMRFTPVAMQGYRDLRYFFTTQAGLDDHLGRELHTGAPLVEPFVHGLGESAQATVDIVMKKDDKFPGPLNLGNPAEVSIRELAETIVRMTGSKSEIVSKPLPHDDPERRKPDSSVAQQHIGWAPVTDLAKGLAHTIDYFSHRLTREGLMA